MTVSYEIKAGDTLWLIAQRELGDPLRWDEIYRRNLDTIGPDPDFLQIGQTLHLPAPAEKTPEK